MDRKRRAFLKGMAPVAVAAPLGFLAISSSARMGGAPGAQSPGPRPPGMPPLDEDSPKIDPTAILKHNQQEILDDAKKLFTLASDLKEQVEKTDSANVLSLPIVRKTKEIEDLAKRIRSLALD
jgi:hypothetical protein